MTKRLTIVIDEENYKNLILKKSRGMVALNKNYSFSRVVNDVLRAGFRELNKQYITVTDEEIPTEKL